MNIEDLKKLKKQLYNFSKMDHCLSYIYYTDKDFRKKINKNHE